MARLQHRVVVIPGIGGSVLETVGGSPVWGQGLPGLVQALVDPGRLSLAENRTLRPTGLLPSTRVLPWKTVPGYDCLVRQLVNTFHLGDEDVDVAWDGPPRKPGASVVLFPYDFRLGVPAAAGRLAHEVDKRLADLTANARRKRVIVVAHSMGGLVARFWLGPLEGASVCKALVTLGTPHRGAPKALDWLLNGVRVGPGPVGAVTGRLLSGATEVLRGWSSTYELLPRYRAVREEGSGRLCYPHELEVAGGSFRERAREAFGMHRAIEDGWPAPDSPERPDVLALFARGHATPSRSVWAGGRVRVSKADAEWQPNCGWRGDGTVPAISAYPVELSDEPLARRAVPDRHGPMATTSAAVDVVCEYEAESTAGLRGDTPKGPWLGLDIDDVVAAGEPFRVGAELLGADDAGGAVAWVRVVEQDPHGAAAAAAPLRMTGGDGRWEVAVPDLAPGVYRIAVEAVGVPRVDRVVGHEVVGVIEA